MHQINYTELGDELLLQNWRWERNIQGSQMREIDYPDESVIEVTRIRRYTPPHSNGRVKKRKYGGERPKEERKSY